MNRGETAVDDNAADTAGFALATAASEGEARQRAIYAALPSPVLVTTPDGHITDANPAARAFFGGQTRFANRPIRDLLPMVEPGAATPAATSWHGAATDARNQIVDVDVVRTRLTGGQLPPSDLYVVHDVSKFAELNRLREELLYNVAHELRGPLGVLENVIEILSTEYASLTVSDFEQLLQSGRRTATRLHDLMEDLLCAGSIQSGRFAVNPRPTPVETLIAEGVEAVEGGAGERGQSIDVHYAEQGLLAMADRRHASRVVANLLSNASKYGPEQQRILVTVEPKGGFVRVTVEDRGPGISAEQQVGLFERFYRVSSPSEAPGVGLGLAIVRGIIEAHGGGVGVESAPRRGTRVWFELPLATSNEQRPTTHGPQHTSD